MSNRALYKIWGIAAITKPSFRVCHSASSSSAAAPTAPSSAVPLLHSSIHSQNTSTGSLRSVRRGKGEPPSDQFQSIHLDSIASRMATYSLSWSESLLHRYDSSAYLFGAFGSCIPSIHQSVPRLNWLKPKSTQPKKVYVPSSRCIHVTYILHSTASSCEQNGHLNTLATTAFF